MVFFDILAVETPMMRKLPVIFLYYHLAVYLFFVFGAGHNTAYLLHARRARAYQ